MVTIKDISKLSGYSVTTVSKCLNDYADIPQTTKNKILKLCKEVGYVPNSSARSLKTHRSYTIGVVFEEASGQGLQHPLFSKILESFKNVVEKAGYDIIFLARSIGKQHGSYLEHSKRKQVEGILVLCADFNSKEIIELSQSDIPVTVLDFSVKNALNITSDNDEGVRLAVEHLINLGHTKIAHIFGDRNSYIGGNRKLAFEELLKEHNLPVNEDYLVDGEFFSKDEGYVAMQQLMRLEDPPTAIFCASDLLAIGAILATREAGKKVPDDYSIIGFDGIDLGQLITPTLSTIKQDTKIMGEAAARNMMKMIEKEFDCNEINTITINTELIIGESTKSLK